MYILLYCMSVSYRYNNIAVYDGEQLNSQNIVSFVLYLRKHNVKYYNILKPNRPKTVDKLSSICR